MTSRRGGGEDGAYLVLYALMTIAVFAMAALVLDLAAVRQDRRAARLSADLAATAGAVDLDLAAPNAAVNACRATWDYLRANTRGLNATAPDCAITFAGACAPSTARTATVTAPPFTIQIVNPVPDLHPFMQRELNRGDVNQSVTTSDGDPCERVGVGIRRARDAAFGPAIGFMGSVTDVHAVARSVQTTAGGVFVTLGLLEPNLCNVLSLTNMQELRVGGGAGSTGVVWVDSAPTSCAPVPYLLNPGSGAITVASSTGTGSIYAWAATLNRGQLVAPSTGVTPTVAAVAPRPLGRDSFDDRYNCTDPTCAPNPPAINQLVTALGSGIPAGYVPFADCSGTVQPVPGLNHYVTCTQVTGSLTFTGDVVFANSIQVTNQGCLAVNSTRCGGVLLAPRDTIVFARGDISNPGQGDVHLEQTMVYAVGRILLDRGNAALRWTAPLGGPFEDLLLWTENAGANHIEEQNTEWVLEGALFLPRGSLELRATTPLPKPVQPVLRAQIHSRSLSVVGSGRLIIQPVASRGVITPVRTVRLVR